MAEDLFSVWNPLQCDKRELNFNPEYVPSGAPLSEKQKEALVDLTHFTRLNDLQYLNKHLLVRAIIREFIQQLVLECPLDVRKFGRKFFSQPKEELCEKISKHVDDFRKIRIDVLAGDSSSTSSSDSSKLSSSHSSKVGKCFSVTLSEILGLPKMEIAEPQEIPLTPSSSTSTESWGNFDFTFRKIEEAMEEGIAEGDYKSQNCDCCTKSI